MSDAASDISSLEERPVYFRPFTRESLRAIRDRMEEEAAKKEQEKQKAEEVNSIYLTYFKLL